MPYQTSVNRLTLDFDEISKLRKAVMNSCDATEIKILKNVWTSAHVREWLSVQLPIASKVPLLSSSRLRRRDTNATINAMSIV